MSLGLSVATNLLAATSQRRYAIKPGTKPGEESAVCHLKPPADVLGTIALMEHDDKAKLQNDLINHRLTWLGTFEGLLFVANS